MKTIIFLANGFEEIEAITIIDILRRADVECEMCSITDSKMVEGAHGITVEADRLLDELLEDGTKSLIDIYDVVILPGGQPGINNLKNNSNVIDIVKNMYENEKVVAAICAAPIVLEAAGIIKGKRITSYPNVLKNICDVIYTGDMVTRDGNIITGRGPGAAADFAYLILETLNMKEEADKLRNEMFFNNN